MRRSTSTAAKVKTLDVKGAIDQAEVDLLIGMNREQRKQSHPVRPFATLPAWFALDGIIDELKIHSAATTDFLPEPANEARRSRSSSRASCRPGPTPTCPSAPTTTT